MEDAQTIYERMQQNRKIVLDAIESIKKDRDALRLLGYEVDCHLFNTKYLDRIYMDNIAFVCSAYRDSGRTYL